jgi:hypothetical protein
MHQSEKRTRLDLSPLEMKGIVLIRNRGFAVLMGGGSGGRDGKDEWWTGWER